MREKKTIGSINNNSIPYKFCYEEKGMIEIEDGVFTICYRLLKPKVKQEGNYNSKLTRMIMKKIFVELSKFLSFEFTMRNCYMEKEEYLSKVTIAPQIDAYTALREQYNQIIRENCDIGNNNFTREEYLTVSLHATTPDDALKRFEATEPTLIVLFQELYGFRLDLMNLTTRLELLYHIYHPGMNQRPFGSKVDYDGNGFSLKSMQRMKLSTKDVIAPGSFASKSNDYLLIGQSYVRSFFINCIPRSVTDSMFGDLLAVSSDSIVSIHYRSVDQKLGFNVSAKLVKENTEVDEIPLRESIEDRKAHRIKRIEKNVTNNEEEYFYKSALNQFKDSNAKDEPLMQTSFIITLFANTIDELDRDTDLLKMVASKYAIQIRCFDSQQNKGFQSVLPLNNLKVNVGRFLSVEELAAMQPINVHENFESTSTYYGLNCINDNLVFVDRSNCPVAMIAGIEKSGKTSALKREIVNTLMCTDDDAIILTAHPDEYLQYTKLLDGIVIYTFHPDIFQKDDNYNLNHNKRALQKIFLKAFLSTKLELRKKYCTPDISEKMSEQLDHEALVLSEFGTWNDALYYAKDNPVDAQMFIKALDQQLFTFDTLNRSRRLTVLGFVDESELLINLDYLWNYAVQMKKKNKTVRIYIDGIDDLIVSPESSDYLSSILERSEILKVPITFVVQKLVRIVTNQLASIEFDYLLQHIQFFRLLSMGPVERNRMIDRLNISQQLVPYIIEKGPGEGIIVSPSMDVPVMDHFDNNEFYQLFR